MFVRDCGLNIILLGLFDLGIIYEITYELNIKVLKLGKKTFLVFFTYQFFVASDT